MSTFVAVTTTVVPESGSYRRPEIALYSIYAAVLERIGLTPVLITPVHSPHSVEALVARCSGLVLTGGEDIDPSRYGEDPVPELGTVNSARDSMEATALGYALEYGMPVLGICRGCQMLNVFLGGTLYQDIDTQWMGADPIAHRQEEWIARTHDVTVDPESRLAAMVGCCELRINSFHHQAVRDVAPALRVVARAEDGLVEAIEAPDDRWIVGVQWHPERHEATAPKTDPDRRLFLGFRDVVEQHARDR